MLKYKDYYHIYYYFATSKEYSVIPNKICLNQKCLIAYISGFSLFQSIFPHPGALLHADINDTVESENSAF